MKFKGMVMRMHYIRLSVSVFMVMSQIMVYAGTSPVRFRRSDPRSYSAQGRMAITQERRKKRIENLEKNITQTEQQEKQKLKILTRKAIETEKNIKAEQVHVEKLQAKLAAVSGGVEKPESTEKLGMIEKPASVGKPVSIEKLESIEKSGVIGKPASAEKQESIEKPESIEKSGIIEKPVSIEKVSQKNVLADELAKAKQKLSSLKQMLVENKKAIAAAGALLAAGFVAQQLVQNPQGNIALLKNNAAEQVLGLISGVTGSVSGFFGGIKDTITARVEKLVGNAIKRSAKESIYDAGIRFAERIQGAVKTAEKFISPSSLPPSDQVW